MFRHRCSVPPASAAPGKRSFSRGWVAGGRALLAAGGGSAWDHSLRSVSQRQLSATALLLHLFLTRLQRWIPQEPLHGKPDFSFLF